jgi:hypothetical protein
MDNSGKWQSKRADYLCSFLPSRYSFDVTFLKGQSVIYYVDVLLIPPSGPSREPAKILQQWSSRSLEEIANYIIAISRWDE